MKNYEIEKKIQDEFSKLKCYKTQSDKLKKNCYIYARYPVVSKYSIELNDIRTFTYADVYTRYYCYNNKNTLFTVGINNTSKKLYENVNNKILSKEDPYTSLKESSYNDLYSIDIGFDFENKLESHSKEFIYFIQEAFLKLYNFNHIIKVNEFYLDIENIKEDLVNQLSYNDMYDELKDVLKYDSGLIFHFETSNYYPLKIIYSTPQYLTGVNFIALNTSFINVRKYYLDSEKDYIIKSLKQKKSLGAFSGNYAINPITKKEIPIIISNFFKEDIRVGNSIINDVDLFFSSSLGLPINDILTNEKTLINSGFLNGISVEEVDLISKICIDNSLATFYENINLDKLQISYEFTDGISIPFFENFYIEKNNLPVLIDSINNVRTLNGKLSENKITNQVFNQNITQAFLTLASRVKSKIGITNYSSKDFLLEIQEYKKIDYAIFRNKEEYLYSLVLNMIVLKSLNIKYDYIFTKISIEGSLFDRSGLEVQRENNNLININDTIKHYGACCLRLNMLSKSISENYFYNPEEIINNNKIIEKFKQIFSFDMKNEFKDLDIHYQKMLRDITFEIENFSLDKFIVILTGFLDICFSYNIISFKQAKGLLIVFSLIAPSICESINKEKFNSKYPLMYEAWPI